jgi:CRP-like cAMP-binding protein/ribonuclease BN (tRNA processing enzyme)
MGSAMQDQRSSDRVQVLPNNMYVVNTRAGDILVNSPPEALKYLLANGLTPPAIVLIPPDVQPGQMLGSSGFVRRGINYASVEFLLYSTFFGKGGQKTQLITVTTDQAQRLHQVLEETISGPTDPAVYGSFGWVQQECSAVGYFPPLRRAPQSTDLSIITSLETGGGVLDGVTITLEGDFFVFREDDEVIAKVSTLTEQVAVPLTVAPPQPMQRQELTLQFIGGSDGFDPAGITTCFLAYLGTSAAVQATLFDAAAYVNTRLGSLGISASQIAEVVISHLHEDHFAGLPELLLMGDHRVRVVTSDVIYSSMLRLLSALLALPTGEVAALFDFSPVNPGQPLELKGRRFEAIYAVHSIPTIAVRVNNLCYSGDMRYDENWFAELESRGVLSAARRDELLHFAEGASVLVQDAGGGPIHSTITPELIAALTAKSQRLILAHTSKHLLPEGQGDMDGRIEFAGSGHVFALGEMLPNNEQIEITESLTACALFARLTSLERSELAAQAKLIHLADGDSLLHEGEASDGNTYIVHSGLVEILQKNQQIRLLGRGSSIGERGALHGDTRTSTMRARGVAEVLQLSPEVFRPIAERLGLSEAFERANWLWQHPVLRDLPWATLLDLALDFEPRRLEAGEELFAVGDPGYEGYILVSGSIRFTDENDEFIDELSMAGELFGGRAIFYGTLRSATARASQPSEVWSLPSPALQRLQMLYPNLIMHLRVVESARSRKRVVA